MWKISEQFSLAKKNLELDPRVGTKWKDSLDLHSDHSDKRKDRLWK